MKKILKKLEEVFGDLLKLLELDPGPVPVPVKVKARGSRHNDKKRAHKKR